MGEEEGERGNCASFEKRKKTRGSCDDDQQHHLLLLFEDVLIHILLGLPVISLLRFKSVCKSWRSIIDSHFFIHLHATTTLLPPSSLFAKLGGCSKVFFNGGEKHKKKVKRGNICTLSVDVFLVFENLGRPPLMDGFKLLKKRFSGWMKYHVVGCCNGVICLHDSSTRNIILWNPAIKQSRVVPKPSNLLGNPNWFDDDDCYVEDVVAFGFDVKTKDYKVLLITNLRQTYGDEHMKGECRIHVYSLSTDSWRCIDAPALSDAHSELRIHKYIVDQGVSLIGNNFFKTTCMIKVHEYLMHLMLSFDFTKEIFRTIPPPYDDLRNKNTFTEVYFIPFDEKIALVGAKQNGGFDIWALKEQNGVKESWTKIYTIEKSINQPLCIMNNGEVAICQDQVDICQDLGLDDDVPKLRLLNLITGETKHIQSDRLGHADRNVCIYKPSLVQIARQKLCNNK